MPAREKTPSAYLVAYHDEGGHQVALSPNVPINRVIFSTRVFSTSPEHALREGIARGIARGRIDKAAGEQGIALVRRGVKSVKIG